MKIELDPSQVDAVTSARIKQLEKEVKSLTTKLQKLEQKNRELKDGMDLTKEARDKIRNLAVSLVEALQDKRLVDYYGYGDL